VEDCRGVAFEFSEGFEVLVSAIKENHLIVTSDGEYCCVFVKLDF